MVYDNFLFHFLESDGRKTMKTKLEDKHKTIN